MSDLEDKTRAVWRGARHASVGLEMGVAVGIGALAGWWLDGRYGWSPWGVLIGTLLGVGAAVNTLVRVVRDVQRESEDEDRRARRQEEEGRPRGDE